MLRRLIWTVGGAGILAGLVFGKEACSYLSTAGGLVKSSVRNSVPVGFEIDRARKLVADIVPDIRKNMHVIAQEEVEIDRLSKQIAQADTGLAKQKDEMIRLRDDASQARTVYVYHGRSYTETQVKQDLANRFARYKTSEGTVNNLRDILAARQKGLDAAREKLEAMLAQKRQLEVEVENLEAQHQMVQVAQTSSKYNLDDSQLGRCKDLVGDIRARLAVDEKMAVVEGDLHDSIPVSQPGSENIVEQITQYFSPAAVEVANR
jgi:predicted RNA-binding protein YlxR (DUF448 family)